MQRVGEMSDALPRFRSYMWSAESLEKAVYAAIKALDRF